LIRRDDSHPAKVTVDASFIYSLFNIKATFVFSLSAPARCRCIIHPPWKLESTDGDHEWQQRR
jgi:hypothetical protein